MDQVNGKPFALALIAFSIAAAASTSTTETITYSDLAQKPAVKIELISIDGIRLNKNCNNKCLALKAFKRAKSPKPESNLQGYALAPSSILCRNLDGHVVLLTDELSNQHVFCRFQDDSMFSPDDWLTLNPKK